MEIKKSDLIQAINECRPLKEVQEENDFLVNVCGNCDKLYDCDNNAHEKKWLECMKNGKMR